MRIWHEQLIPKLCQKHLCAMWREGLGCYKIITECKKGYRNHPAVKEWIDAPDALWIILLMVRIEMVKRGYRPKLMPEPITSGKQNVRRPWQSLEQQIEILKAKGCKCKI